MYLRIVVIQLVLVGVHFGVDFFIQSLHLHHHSKDKYYILNSIQNCHIASIPIISRNSINDLAKHEHKRSYKEYRPNLLEDDDEP